MRRFSKIFSSTILFLFLFVTTRALAASSAVNKFINSADKTAINSGLATEDQTKEENLFQKLTGGFINQVLNILGVVFLILIIYGGIIWMTASGNEDKVRKARGIIAHSVIGLSVILLSKVIAYVVIDILLPLV